MVGTTRSQQASRWEKWREYCSALNLDSHLIGVKSPESILQVFLIRVRRGAYNKGNERVRAGTVAQYLSAISKEIIRMVDETERTSAIAPNSVHHSLRELFKGFARDDPLPNRVWPVNGRILQELCSMACPPTFQLDQWRRIQDMCVIGFFFLLRPGEYAKPLSSDAKAKPFRVEDVYFLDQHSNITILPSLQACNDTTQHHFGGLRVVDSKAGAKGDRITHERTNDAICPVTSLHRIVHDILIQHGSHTTPLYCYHDRTTNRFQAIESKHLTAALRLAAAACYTETGIPPDKITARSLRAGGATALLCAGVDIDIVKLIGKWRSDAVEVYLRTSTHTLTAGFASKMLQHGSYKFTSYTAETLNTLPDLVPDDLRDDIYEAYIRDITGGSGVNLPTHVE